MKNVWSLLDSFCQYINFLPASLCFFLVHLFTILTSNSPIFWLTDNKYFKMFFFLTLYAYKKGPKKNFQLISCIFINMPFVFATFNLFSVPYSLLHPWILPLFNYCQFYFLSSSHFILMLMCIQCT